MAKKSNPYKHYNRITTYEDFVDYCLRKLGAPVINIEVTPEQIFDRVSDAIQYYLEYDLESVVEIYWIHRCTKEDVENGYLTIPLEVLDVMEVLSSGANIIYSDATVGEGSFSSYSISSVSSVEMAWNNPTYLWWNNYWNYYSTFSGNQSLFYYEVSMQYINSMRTLFNAKIEYTYRRRQRKLWLMSKPYSEGTFICLYGTKILDPETDDCIWESDWLKNYAMCLIGIQWGINLSKFGNVPSAGGLTINGEAILSRYTEMKEKLEEQHKKEFQEPPMPFFCN